MMKSKIIIIAILITSGVMCVMLGLLGLHYNKQRMVLRTNAHQVIKTVIEPEIVMSDSISPYILKCK